jgi:hypothetical protein
MISASENLLFRDIHASVHQGIIGGPIFGFHVSVTAFAGEGGGNAINAQADNGTGVNVVSFGGGDAVHGEVDDASHSGVTGINDGSGWGVYGNSSTGDGVHGQVADSSAGVAGENTSSGPGVYASSSSGYGVQAYGGTSGTAAWGTSGGVYGSGGTNGYGVYGVASSDDVGNSGTGVYGEGNGSYSFGVFGTCSAGGGPCYGVYSDGALYIAGDLDGSGTQHYSSDERLKKDIQPLKQSLDTLLRLKGVSFYWRDPSKHGNHPEIQRGFIAQDYEKVFPEWVATDKDGYKMISTTGLDSLEVESIRQLKAENDDLKSRLDRLESSRKVVVAGNAWGFAIGGLALGCGLIVTQRKKKDEDEPKKDEKKRNA